MSQSRENRCPCVIVGGGMVGLGLALALAKQQVPVTLLEKTPYASQIQEGFDGRVSAIAYGTTLFLEEIGAWQAMRPHAEPILDIRIVDGDAPQFLHYDHQDVGSDPMGYIIENRYIRQGLLSAANEQPGITMMEGRSLLSTEQAEGGLTLQLDDGTTLITSLAVAADGKRSQLRDMAGITISVKDYHQTAIVCMVSHSEPHDGVALERFLPSGPFAVLPMTDDASGTHRSAVVWTEKTTYAEGYLALDKAAFNAELQQRFGEYWGEVSMPGKRWSYPLTLLKANRMVAPRVALIGDAAHGIHPIAGQGVNLGLRDAQILAQKVARHHHVGLDIGDSSVLDDYERARRLDITSMMQVTDGLNELFRSPFAPVIAARRLGLATVNRIPPLKQLLMRHAMGILLPR